MVETLEKVDPATTAKVRLVTGPKGGTLHYVRTDQASGRTLCGQPAPAKGWQAPETAEADAQVCAKCGEKLTLLQASAQPEGFEQTLAEAEAKLNIETTIPDTAAEQDAPSSIVEAAGQELELTAPAAEDSVEDSVEDSDEDVVADEALARSEPTQGSGDLFSEAEPVEQHRERTRRQRKAAAEPIRIDGECALCGKPLRRGEHVTRGLGALCYARVENFVARQNAELPPDERINLETCDDETLEQMVAAVRDESTFDRFTNVDAGTLTETHLPFPEIMAAVKAAGKSVSSLVKAMGGDRARAAASQPYWQPIYFDRKRWVPKEALNHLNELRPGRAA